MTPAQPAQVTDLTNVNFADEIINAEGFAVIDFWAPWCPPCRQMKPEFAKAAEELTGEARFYAANVDEYPDMAQAFGVQGIPAFAVVKDKTVYAMFSGYMPAAQFVAQIRAAMSAA